MFCTVRRAAVYVLTLSDHAAVYVRQDRNAVRTSATFVYLAEAMPVSEQCNPEQGGGAHSPLSPGAYKPAASHGRVMCGSLVMFCCARTLCVQVKDERMKNLINNIRGKDNDLETAHNELEVGTERIIENA